MLLEGDNSLNQSIGISQDWSPLSLDAIDNVQTFIEDPLSHLSFPLFSDSDHKVFSSAEDTEHYQQYETYRKSHIEIKITCLNELHGCPWTDRIMLPCDCSRCEFALRDNDDFERNPIAIPREHLFPAIQMDSAIRIDPDSVNSSFNSLENDHCYPISQLKIRRPAPIVKVCNEKSDFDPGYVDVETVSDDNKSENDRVTIQLKRTYKKKTKTTNTDVDSAKVTYPSTSRTTASKKTFQQLLSSITEGTKKRKRTTNSSPPSHECSSSQSSSESEDIEKRSMHNNMERIRREDQRDALHCLRQCVPTLKDNPKASKVTILNKANEYIAVLKKVNRDHRESKKYEMQKNKRLNKELKKFLKS